MHRRQVQRAVAGAIIALGAAKAAVGIALWSCSWGPVGPRLDALAVLVVGLLEGTAGVLAAWSFRVAMTLGGSLAVGLAICGLFFSYNWSLPTVVFGAIGVTGIAMLLFGEQEKRRDHIRALNQDADHNSL